MSSSESPRPGSLTQGNIKNLRTEEREGANNQRAFFSCGAVITREGFDLLLVAAMN